MERKKFVMGDLDVLLADPDQMRGDVRKNLCGIRGDAVVWTAHLPGYPDHFTDAWPEGSVIKAYAFSGYIVTLDPEDGHTISAEFTK